MSRRLPSRPPDNSGRPDRPGHSVDLEKGVDDMTIPKSLQSPERDVLLVSALISILVVLAFTDWGAMAYVVTGLVLALL
jgi:hypothetical protein